MNLFGVRLGSRGSATLTGGGSLLSGLLSALIIALSARRGMTADIAAYTVMLALQAIVTGITAGGSSILHMSGDDRVRADVRRHRLLVILPVMAVAGLAGSFFYTQRGYALLPLLAVAVVAMANNLGELYYGDLQRGYRFLASVCVALSTKSAAVLLVLLGMRLSFALLLAAGFQLLLLEIAASQDSWLRNACRSIRSEPHRRVPLRPGLLAYSYIELYNSRVPVFALSLISTPALMGQYGVVLAAYQALTGVFYASMQVVLATRVRQRRGLQDPSAPHQGVEAPILLLGVLASVGLLVVSRPLVFQILLLKAEDAAIWLMLLALAIPGYLVNRMFVLVAIADDRQSQATRVAACIALVLTLVLVPGILLLGITGATLGTAVSELSVAVAVAVAVARARRGRPPVGQIPS